MTHTPDDDLTRLSDGELLGRLCGTNGPALSLLDLLWRDAAARPTEIEAERPEVGFLLGCAVDVIRDVALGQVDLMNPLGDQKALARYLFLRYSRRRGDVVVTMYLDERHRWIDDRAVFTGDAQRSEIPLADILTPALDAGAPSLAMFHLRAAGESLPTAAELERTGRVRAAARVLGMELLDSWVVVSPRLWSPQVGRFMGPTSTYPPGGPPGDGADDRPRKAWKNEHVLWRSAIDLAAVLGRGRLSERGAKLARKVLTACHGPAGLATASPEQLGEAGLDSRQIETLQLTLEIGRRLGDLSLPTSGPILWDSEEIARNLLKRFAQWNVAATGAMLLNDERSLLRVRVLEESELRNPAVASAVVLSDALAAGATQVVPFLFKPARRPDIDGEDIELYLELQESRLYFGLEMPDVLYVWSSGHYLARRRGGRLQRVRTP